MPEDKWKVIYVKKRMTVGDLIDNLSYLPMDADVHLWDYLADACKVEETSDGGPVDNPTFCLPVALKDPEL